MKLRLGDRLNFVGSETGGDFAKLEAAGRNVNDSEIGDDGINAFERSQRVGAWSAEFSVRRFSRCAPS